MLNIAPRRESARWKMNKISTNLSLISFNDNDEEREMHSKSDNIEIMVYDKADEV